jgi:S1-C subfamily serine protease
VNLWDQLLATVSSFSTLDWALVVLTVAFAIIGWVQGLVVGVLSFVGFVGGAALGLLVVPQALGRLQPGLGTAVLASLLVVVTAGLGYGILSALGDKLRARLGDGPVRAVDGLAGAFLAAAGFLLAAWGIGLAVSSAAIPGLSAAARSSQVLATVDARVPMSPDRLEAAFRQVLEAGRFPQVVAPFVEEQIVAVEPPDPQVRRSDAIRAAVPSVLRVTAESPRCGQVQEGSSVVVGPERVLTNAHVVAGADRVSVAPANGVGRAASVVFFDPSTDVAVLDVPDLDVGAVAVARPPGAAARNEVAVAGYPRGGPLEVDAARVRSVSRLIGLDIYGRDQVTREVIALRARVVPGNSGGPVLDTAGQVTGLVFATSMTDRNTGYALPVSELRRALRVAALDSVPAVPTGGCLP